MSIQRHDDRMQVTCDSCPAGYPNTYAPEDFRVMIADAKTAGWRIAKAPPPAKDADTSDLFGSAPRVAGAEPQAYTHTCPACRETRSAASNDLL